MAHRRDPKSSREGLSRGEVEVPGERANKAKQPRLDFFGLAAWFNVKLAAQMIEAAPPLGVSKISACLAEAFMDGGGEGGRRTRKRKLWRRRPVGRADKQGEMPRR